MTILNYVVRVIVSFCFAFSFFIALATYLESTRYDMKAELITYVCALVFVVFACLLWIIK